MGWKVSCAYLVCCVSRILFRRSLGMDVRCAAYSVRLTVDHVEGFVLYLQVQYIKELIIDTENVIRHLEPKIQNSYRYLAAEQIKHIMTTNRRNTLHKRYQYNINQLKNTNPST